MLNLTRDELDRLIGVSAQMGPWVLPVLDAVRQGTIGMALLTRGDRAPLADLRRSPVPMLVWLGDDDEASCGPDGWRPALAAIHWARGAMVHAAAGERQHYLQAVAGTLATKRLLLVETNSRHALAWLSALHGVPTLAILPRGADHRPPTPETRH